MGDPFMIGQSVLMFFWKFSNNRSNSASVAYAMVYIMILYSTYTGRFSVGISVIGLLLMYFGPRKKDPLDLLSASGS